MHTRNMGKAQQCKLQEGIRAMQKNNYFFLLREQHRLLVIDTDDIYSLSALLFENGQAQCS